MSYTTAKRALFGASMLGGLLAAAAAAAAPALPTGGHVAAGSASIGAAGATLTVSQSSAKAIVDWSGFSIGQGGTVQFDNGAGATLNRVTGTGVSSIDGLLSATGSVYLINPNGVIVGKTGVVNTGGSFVASTLDVANSSFLAGGPLAFSGPSTASVINLGKVGSLGGNVGLIAATVKNDGALAAPKGDVGLAAGSTVIMDDAANDAGGLFTVKVGDASTSATNAGAISAAAVELRAQQGNIYALAGNTGGVINATGVDAAGGVIKLISTVGTTEVAGALSAQGPGGAGGQIETSGEQLTFGAAASVDAHGGAWLLDPTNLIVDSTAAGVIDGALSGGAAVTLQTFASGAPSGPAGTTGNTAAGNGDIIIAAPLTWSSGGGLALDAYHDVDIDAPITVTGNGAVLILADAVNFAYGPGGFTGNIAFTGKSGSNTLGVYEFNSIQYKLENNLASLASDIAAKPNGFFALANSYDASGDGTYGAAVIPTGFTGTFEGLGNTISNLTISANTAPADEGIGLFDRVIGNISDLAIIGGSLTGNANVGPLAGFDGGFVNNVHSSMPVTGFFLVGGLIGEFGEPGSTLTNSSATGTVTGEIVDASSSGNPGPVGGLIGMLDAGSVTSSYATGAVTALGGEQVGGLIGDSNGNNNSVVSHSYATGAVNAGVNASFIAGSSVGGLIGDNGGAVIDSYATGSVIGTQNVGGLIGINENDAPGTSATNPTGDGTVVKSFATGAVTGYVDAFGNEGIDVGGLIGFNEGAVANAYSMGAVTGGDQLGGLTGADEGSLSSVYSTGLVRAAVGATPTEIGGLIGEDDTGGGQIQFAYWDTFTSGQPTVGVGAFGTAGEVTGFTTAKLQSTATVGVSLGAAFAGGAAGGQDGVYPYLVDFFPNGVQAVDGFAYSDAGKTALTGATVGVIANGVSLGTTTTGANGYFYFLTAAGGVPSGQSVLAYNDTPHAATLATSTGATETILNLYGNTLSGSSSDTTFSQLVTDYIPQFAAATGGNSQAAAAILNANGLYLIATGASFTLDEAFTANATDSMLVIKTTAANAPITIAQPVTIDGTNTLELDASGALSIDAAVSIAGAGIVTLTAAGENDGGSTLNPFLTFASGDSISFAPGAGEGIAGQALTIEGASYTLLYSMTDVAAINNGSGYYALAQGVNASSTSYTAAVVGNFYGRLEGLGNTITGLTINSVGNYVGLFGEVNTGGIVRDIGLSGGGFAGFNFVGSLVGYNEAGARISGAFVSGATVTSGGGADVGGLAGADTGTIVSSISSNTVDNSTIGYATGGLVGGVGAAGVITASSASGIVSGAASYTGGLVGYNDGMIGGASSATGDVGATTGAYVGGLAGYNAAAGTITDDSASGTVTASTKYVGGLVGYNAGAISAGSSATGNVLASGASYVGGLVGFNAAAGTVTDATTSGGAVSGDGGAAIGGLVGYNAGGAITGSSAADTVDNDAAGYATGGLVGYNATGSTLTDSSATGSVTGGAHYTGGLAGYNAGSISSSFATGNVGAASGFFVGGLAGYNVGTINDTYAYSGTVSGLDDVGGLAGYNAGGISTSWSSGAVSGTSDLAGSIGKVGGGTITDVYWDEGTSGRTNATASGASTGMTGIGGTTGRDSHAQATYTGFNFTTTWTINAGTSRPFLLDPTPATPPN